MIDENYISKVFLAPCILCGEMNDLRCGVCFECTEFVAGRPILGGHELWDSRNPEIRWNVNHDGKFIPL